MKVILFFFLFFSIICNSQSGIVNNFQTKIYTDTINGESVKKITKDLEKFIIIKNYSEEEIEIEVIEDENDHSKTKRYTRDYQEFTKYLFYIKDYKLFVKKFDNYGEYNSVEIKNETIFPFLNKNIKMIKKERLKNYCVKIISTDNKVEYHYLTVPVPLYTEIFVKAKNIDSNTKYHFLDMKNENDENINYNENLKLKVIQLENMCKKEIHRLEEMKSFLLI